ncbi:MAG: acyl-[acyl-carrier-protein] thioesterase [Acidimicrobiales bacterium]
MDADPNKSGPGGGEALAPYVGGRSFVGAQRVRLGDVSPHGWARLDALARYLQDVANDDAYDSGIDNPGVWVVRRSTIEVYRRPTLREDLTLRTFCSGTGACWAERRTSVTGSGGAHLEAAVLWVQLDSDGTRPARLGPDFAAVYGESAAGRKVRANLTLDQYPPAGPTSTFPLRRTDLDVMGHVNNAVYWGMLEEVVSGELVGEPLPGVLAGGNASPTSPASPAPTSPYQPVRFDLEHHQPIDPGANVQLHRSGRRLWITAAGALAAVAAWSPPAGQEIGALTGPQAPIEPEHS